MATDDKGQQEYESSLTKKFFASQEWFICY